MGLLYWNLEDIINNSIHCPTSTISPVKVSRTMSNVFPYPPRKVQDYPTFLPEQPQPIGSLLDDNEYKQNKNPPKLFHPITIRGVTFHNRAFVAPMCMCTYCQTSSEMSSRKRTDGVMKIDSSDQGRATDHHFVHLGSMALRGWGSIMVEATAVVPEGRISPEDMVSDTFLII